MTAAITTLYQFFSNSLAGGTVRALANLTMFTRLTLVSPRSTVPIKVRWQPTRSASFSCEIPAEVRISRSCLPNKTLGSTKT